ncbi:MAG: acyl-CoA thioesterase [Lachnospiraceae bacterium]|nr:acyl-CoA thioesterase [Lachnospiraceae bacterium]
MHEKGSKKVSDSYTEWIKMVRYEDINAAGRLFGGRLMEWMDEVAGLCALRHSGCEVTTAAVDDLQFKKGVYVGDVLVVVARVTHVGNTSIEVRADVYVEDKVSGYRNVINRAYFTEVCIDKNGKPSPVPYDIVPETEGEKADYDSAKKRIEMRKMRRKEGF